MKLTVDSRELRMIKNTGQLQQMPCSECAGQMVVSQQAIALAGASSRELHREIEAGIIHFAETADGALLVCLNSLLLRKREIPAGANERLTEDTR